LVYGSNEQSHQIAVSQHQVLGRSMSISEQRRHHANCKLSLQYSPNYYDSYRRSLQIPTCS